MTNQTALDTARLASLADITEAARGGLALGPRLGYVLLLVVALAGAVALGSLWATEPALPLRTHVAFAGLLAILAAWTVFAAWVLGTRRVLLGRDRVIAGRLAVTFSAFYTVGMAAAGAGTGRPAPWLAAALGLAMTAAAAWLLRRAVGQVAALTARRDALVRQLGRA